jgi:hypothetical protein
MPARSNEFQEVIYLVQTHLAEGSRAEESELLTDLITGAKREVDVCIHSVVGGHDVIVSIECRDHKRRQTVQWVEEMHAKHQRLPTNVLVLASKSGFTGEALTLASKYGIEAVVPGLVPDSFSAEVGRRLEALWLKTIALSPNKFVVILSADDTLPEQRVLLPTDTQLFTRDGQSRSSLVELVEFLLHKEDVYREMARDATGEEKYFQMIFPPPGTGSGLDAFVRIEDVAKPFLRQILALDITGTAVVQVAKIPMTYGEFVGKEYAMGKAVTDTHDLLLVVTDPTPEGEDTSGSKASIRFRPRKAP